MNSLLNCLLVLSPLANAALVAISNFGSNPTNLQMNIWVPARPAAKPAVILALHGCGGNGPGYQRSADYTSAAETAGFIVIYPSTRNDNNCWDVGSPKSLLHDGGGDSTGLANMLRYTLSTYAADPSRLFVTGTSSGGMMTNVMAAVYPDLIAAGSAYSGVAAGCFAGSPGFSPISSDGKCPNGQVTKTAAQWVAQVKSFFPAWNGTYPRFQTWHGTADTLIVYHNLGEQVKEWAALHGVAFARNQTDTPKSGYTKMVYGDGTKFVGYSARGVGHTVPVDVSADLKWFGLA